MIILVSETECAATAFLSDPFTAQNYEITIDGTIQVIPFPVLYSEIQTDDDSNCSGGTMFWAQTTSYSWFPIDSSGFKVDTSLLPTVTADYTVQVDATFTKDTVSFTENFDMLIRIQV